ncbi:MAG: AAA family ATPase [Planctomycetes bacterium]|nr:AAA family ATPase [Planctomycetota bacterium]
MTIDLTSAVSRLEAARRGEHRPARARTTQPGDTSIGPVLRNAADIPVEEVVWLWPGRIPGGMLSIVAGDPGLGKSTLTTAIAAIVSTGGSWPDGGSCEAGGVLWLSAEDDPSRVLVPRLIAHGADLSRIVLLDGVRRVPGAAVAHPSLADDLPALEQAIARVPQCRLIIIDPISAYLGRTDANANAEVRAMLTPLKAIAEQTGAAVVLVQHLNKSASANALHRMTGSIGFVGAARTGYIVVRDPDDEQRRLFLCVKSNIGPEANGLGFRIAGEPPRIVFDDEPVLLRANDALAAASPGASEDRSALADAVEWLRDRLAGIAGAPARTVLDDAKSAGLAKRTLERAKGVLKVKTVRAPGAWLWSLPDAGEDRQERQPGEDGDVGDVGDVRPDLPPGW